MKPSAGCRRRSVALWWGPGLIAAALLSWALAYAVAGSLFFFVEAVRENRLEAVRELLDDGADVNEKDLFGGNTGLHWSARQGMAEMARLLLDHGANPNTRNDENETPLHWAAAQGQQELLVILIAHGALVNATDRAGWTPLRWAEAQGHEDVARILEAAGGRR